MVRAGWYGAPVFDTEWEKRLFQLFSGQAPEYGTAATQPSAPRAGGLLDGGNRFWGRNRDVTAQPVDQVGAPITQAPFAAPETPQPAAGLAAPSPPPAPLAIVSDRSSVPPIEDISEDGPGADAGTAARESAGKMNAFAQGQQSGGLMPPKTDAEAAANDDESKGLLGIPPEAWFTLAAGFFGGPDTFGAGIQSFGKMLSQAKALEAEERKQRELATTYAQMIPELGLSPQQQTALTAMLKTNPEAALDIVTKAVFSSPDQGNWSMETIKDGNQEVTAWVNPATREIVPISSTPIRSSGGGDGLPAFLKGAPTGYMWGEGGLTFIPGGPADPANKPLTEDQSKTLGFFTRGTSADEILNRPEIEGAAQYTFDPIKGSIPLIGNAMVSPEYQQYHQAGSDFLAAILRKDTGAAVTSQEWAWYGPMYLPMWGDTPEVLDQKRAARSQAMSALRTGLEGRQALRDLPRTGGAIVPEGLRDTRDQELMQLNQ